MLCLNKDFRVVEGKEAFYVFNYYNKPSKIIDPISMRQCRLKLLQMGLLESVEAEMVKDKALSIEWEYATEIKIDNPLVLMLSEKLGLDEEARVKMFEEARKL